MKRVRWPGRALLHLLPPSPAPPLLLRCLALLLCWGLLGLGLLGLLGSPKGRAGERAPCPSSSRGLLLLPEGLGPWGWEEEAGAEGERWGDEGRKRRRRQIYLHASWRTGSSFVGELFQQHPEVFYLYEPMWHLWQALYPGDALSLQGALRDMLRSLFRCDFSVLALYSSAPQGPEEEPGSPLWRAPNLTTRSLFGWRTNKVICSAPLCRDSPFSRSRVALVEGAACERSCPPRALEELEAECRKAPVVVIKDVRLLQLAALAPLLRDPALDLRVVQLFRDPRAVHNSRLKAKQALLRESIQVLRSKDRPRRLPQPPLPHHHPQPQPPRAEVFLGSALEVICQGWLRDLLLARRGGPPWLRRRYTQLRYEDLVRDPRGQARRLMAFAGLQAPEALQDFALHMARGEGGAQSSEAAPKPFLLSPRDARQGLHAWRERLSRAQVQQVERDCLGPMRILRYPLSTSPDAPAPDPG
ncbi:carbohydrate sulfotransferase 7 [Sceloporus undulatus]|uniref:carbohydrate sulfotransferase 7 n=1 Tax=Sceloporus undulatus TaxID=8520 RepID=UPI001C4D5FA8|nr:carbohydrate sulfotransferase 7 [Sceloporus undulatus]